jgi:hypothetical protein
MCIMLRARLARLACMSPRLTPGSPCTRAMTGCTSPRRRLLCSALLGWTSAPSTGRTRTRAATADHRGTPCFLHCSESHPMSLSPTTPALRASTAGLVQIENGDSYSPGFLSARGQGQGSRGRSWGRGALAGPQHGEGNTGNARGHSLGAGGTRRARDQGPSNSRGRAKQQQGEGDTRRATGQGPRAKQQ